MLYYSDNAIIKSKPYEPSGYVAGHLRFKFIRGEAVDIKSDDDEDDDDDNDDDQDGDGDGSISKEGGIKGSKAQKSREVVTKLLSIKRYFILNKLSPIVDIIPKESEWYDCLATAPEGGVSITAAWTSSDIRLEVQCT
jgi:hypothetical protein